MLNSSFSRFFFQTDFDADLFIAEQRKQMPLESLRNELNMFLKVINASVVELINRDYADFLNLSSHLLSVENLLTGIQQPTEQLRFQVMDLHEVLSGSSDDFKELLKRKTAIDSERRKCERLRELIEVERKLTAIRDSSAFRDVVEFPRTASLIQRADVLHQATKNNVLSKRVGEVSSYFIIFSTLRRSPCF